MSDMADVEITPGTTNVFADLGFPDAAEMQAKTRLAMRIAELVEQRRLSRPKTAQLFGLEMVRAAALANYELDEFSLEELLRFLTQLDQDVEILIRPRGERQLSGQIIVTSVG